MSRNLVAHTLRNIRTLQVCHHANSKGTSSPRNLSASFSSQGTPRASQPTVTPRASTSSKWRTSIAARFLGIFSLVISGYYIAHLEQAPYTNRWRFMDVSPTLENKMRDEARREAEQEFEGRLLPSNHVLSLHIHRVVDRILRSNNLGKLSTSIEARATQSQYHSTETTVFTRPEDSAPNETQWHLFVVNDNHMVNARAEYGTIVIFTGILPIAKDESGLAAIVTHEIGHVIARHNQERISAVKPLLVVESLFSRFFNADLGFSQRLSQLSGTRLFKQQELEADSIGLFLMSRACYDPRSSLGVLARMAKFQQAHTKPGKHGWVATHPTFPERIEILQETASSLYQTQQQLPECAGMSSRLASFHEAQNTS